jgi:hypothetical protein
MVAVLTIANPVLLLCPATSSEHLFFYFRGFYGFNSYRMGETRHTAPSLRLFRPEQPSGVSPFLSSLGSACKFTSLYLGSGFSISRRYKSTTATSAPFLGQLIPSGSLVRCQSLRFIAIIQILLLWSLSTKSCKVFSFFSSLFFNTINLSFLLSLSHTTVGL